MFKISILDKNYGEDFEGLLMLLKKFIVNIYVRNELDSTIKHGEKKHSIIDQALMEFDGKAKLNILGEKDVDTISKRINYQINMARKLIENPSDSKTETRYYILKNDNKVIAFQQAQVMKAGEQIVGLRYIAYTEHNYSTQGEQGIIDSKGNIQYDFCSEALYKEISKWFQENSVRYEKTSTGKNMLSNILTYIIYKGFIPQSKSDRNIYFEKDLQQQIDKRILKKIYKLYVDNLSRTVSKNIDTIIEEVDNIPEFATLKQQQKEGIVRSILIGQEKLSNRQNETMKKLNRITQENIDRMNSHINYNLIYKIANRIIREVDVDNKRENQEFSDYKSKDSKRVAQGFFSFLDEDLYKEVKKIIDYVDKEHTYKDNIEDLYSLVHDLSYGVSLMNNHSSGANELFAEVYPACFEYMLGEYLLKNRILPENDILNIEKLKKYKKIDCCIDIIAQMEMIKIKQERDEITLNDLGDIQLKYNLSNRQFSEIFDRFTSTTVNINYNASYITAQLILPYYIKMYSNNPSEALKKLNEFSKQLKYGNVNEGLRQFGINMSESINVLIKSNVNSGSLNEFENTIKNLNDEQER